MNITKEMIEKMVGFEIVDFDIKPTFNDKNEFESINICIQPKT